MVGMYGGAHMDDARALFMFRPDRQLDYHHRDVVRQKELLRQAFDGLGWEVPRLLARLDEASTFYFDSVTQLRMDTWSRGRISLVGDAGYCPGPVSFGTCPETRSPSSRLTRFTVPGRLGWPYVALVLRVSFGW